jgi:competence protein ComEA
VRGESGRVAERVRHLLAEHGGAPGGEPEAVRAPGPPARAPGFWARLAARVPARIDPGRRAAIAVGLAVALAAVLTGAWVLAARPSALSVSSSGPSGARPGPASTDPAAGPSARSPSAPGPSAPGVAASGPSASASASAELVVVDVAGKVRHPGLYRLPAGSRVDDAVRAAGGPLPRVRLDSLNLAAKLVDGQQIAVGVPAAAGAPAGGALPGDPGGGGAAGGSPAGPVDLNSAGLEQLQTLPGVGPVLAQHIVDWRTAHGRFASVDQLDDVPGIGEVKFAALKALVSV